MSGTSYSVSLTPAKVRAAEGLRRSSDGIRLTTPRVARMEPVEVTSACTIIERATMSYVCHTRIVCYFGHRQTERTWARTPSVRGKGEVMAYTSGPAGSNYQTSETRMSLTHIR